MSADKTTTQAKRDAALVLHLIAIAETHGYDGREARDLAERLRAGSTEAHVHRMTRGSSILGGCECGALYDETGWHEPVARCVSCDQPLPVACQDCTEYAVAATRAPREAYILRARLAAVVEAAGEDTWEAAFHRSEKRRLDAWEEVATLHAKLDAVVGAGRNISTAPSGTRICCCRNVNAVSAGMEKPCGWCVLHAAIDAAGTKGGPAASDSTSGAGCPECHAVDELLARRSALDGLPDRIAKIQKALRVAKMNDPNGAS